MASLDLGTTFLIAAGLSYVAIIGVFFSAKPSAAAWALASVVSFVLGSLYYAVIAEVIFAPGPLPLGLLYFLLPEIVLPPLLGIADYYLVFRPTRTGERTPNTRFWTILLAVAGIPFSVFGTAFILLIAADDAFAKARKREKMAGPPIA